MDRFDPRLVDFDPNTHHDATSLLNQSTGSNTPISCALKAIADLTSSDNSADLGTDHTYTGFSLAEEASFTTKVADCFDYENSNETIDIPDEALIEILDRQRMLSLFAASMPHKEISLDAPERKESESFEDPQPISQVVAKRKRKKPAENAHSLSATAAREKMRTKASTSESTRAVKTSKEAAPPRVAKTTWPPDELYKEILAVVLNFQINRERGNLQWTLTDSINYLGLSSQKGGAIVKNLNIVAMCSLYEKEKQEKVPARILRALCSEIAKPNRILKLLNGPEYCKEFCLAYFEKNFDMFSRRLQKVIDELK
ncbi:MAG TPA: hypothetical protein VLG76_07145 [Rhabdochlamydiaceae bacterium]|nr:hypothetical protein [Rhabdochlamydiaceae bacterium]